MYRSLLSGFSFVFCVLIFCIQSLAADQSCPYDPSAIDHVSKSASEALERVSLNGCSVKELSVECQQRFKENPDTANFASCANEKPVTNTDLTSTCLSSIGGAWTEGLKEIAAGTLKSLAENGHSLKESIGQIPNTAQAVENCDKDIACKRKLAAEANFQFKTDDDLQDVYAGDLMRKREAFREAAKRDPKAKQIYDDQQSTIDQRESEGHFDHGLAKAYNSEHGKTQFTSVTEVAKAQLKSLGVKYQCYNSAGRAHLWCYGFGTVVDPTLVAGGVLKGLKAGRWVAQAFKASKLKPVGEVAKLSESAKALGAGAGASKIGAGKELVPQPPASATHELAAEAPRAAQGTAAKPLAEPGSSLSARGPPKVADELIPPTQASDRIAHAEAVVGRKLSAKQAKAVEAAHNVGVGEKGLDGGPARVGQYTPAQLRRKTEILKNAGFSAGERRKLVEAKVVGLPSTLADGIQPGSEVSIPRSSGDMSNAQVVARNGDSVTVHFTDANGEILQKELPVSDLSPKLASGTGHLARGEEVLVPLSNGSMAEGEVISLENGNAVVRVKQGGTNNVYARSVSASELRTVGSEVSIPRSTGGFSVGKITDRAINGELRVDFEDGAVKKFKYVPPSELRTLASANPAPIVSKVAQPIRAAPISSKQALHEYAGKIEEIAPTTHPSGYGEYHSNGYWRQWAGFDTTTLPAQGWKLHVGAKAETAEQIARALVPELKRRGIMHKVVDDLSSFAELDPRTNTQAGKFITVYPRNDREAREISRYVDDYLKNQGFHESDFIDTPGEKRVGVGVSARYGRFTGGPLQDAHGFEIPGSDGHLLTPNGQVVEDVRGQAAPNWAPDPF